MRCSRFLRLVCAISMRDLASDLNRQHFGVGCLPWNPLARGMTTRLWDGTSTRGTTDP